MSVAGEFERRIGADELCAETARAVREKDGDALRRLGMKGFAEYAGRLSELMTGSVLDGLDWSDDFGELMRQVNSPARYAHHLVNDCGTAVQTALDERQGLRLRVVQPDYNDGRTKGLIGEALSRETPEQGTGLLAAGLGTGVKDAGNEFQQQNAEQRSRAGFAVTVERSGGSNCCPWCSARIGKWELKNAPSDVFGVHDNCTCMVVYTNSRGVRSQRLGRARFVEVNYAPTRLTDGEKRGAGEPKRLTGGGNGGIIGSGGNGGNGGNGNGNSSANNPFDPRKILKEKIESGELPLTINPDKQARHMLQKGEMSKSDGRSFLTISIEEAQQIIDRYSTTGDITYIPKSHRFSELIDTDVIVGVDGRSGKPTSQAFIKYSKSGTHLVPTIKGR